MSGGTRNGSSSTTRSSSANRVLITSALNSVPTATNPTVASAITATSGSNTRPTGTLKNSTNRDRKSTRLNSSHLVISYAVFCLKKKKKQKKKHSDQQTPSHRPHEAQ